LANDSAEEHKNKGLVIGNGIRSKVEEDANEGEQASN
jgi:hypothetical protein